MSPSLTPQKLPQSLSKQNVWSNLQDRIEPYISYLRCVRKDSRWLLMFVLGRFPWGRRLGAFVCTGKKHLTQIKHYLSPSLNASLQQIDSPASIFENLDEQVALDYLHQDGCFIGFELPKALREEMLDYAYTADLSVDGNPQLVFKYHQKEQAEQNYNCQILIGNYLAVNYECTAMQKLVNDPKLLAIAKAYLGKKPLLVRSQMGWTFVGSNTDYAQKGEIGSPTIKYHYDLDDYRALKFFFYLTDVDSASGSHRCVLGSHRKRKLPHYIFRSQTDQQIASFYGTEKMANICGRAGLGFAEDPFCFHRGTPPLTQPRLMIQIEFALNDYGMWEL